MKRAILLAAVAVALTPGCGTYSSNMRVGNDMAYVSLSEQRDASKSITVYETPPEGAKVLGPVDASRCHRSFVESAPSENFLLLDLKIAAYAMGADGLTGVAINKESALARNCWYVMNGTATAIAIPKE